MGIDSGGTLYTPGHGLVADALIMHGLIRVLASKGVYDGYVDRIGDRFRIVLNKPIDEICDDKGGQGRRGSDSCVVRSGIINNIGLALDSYRRAKPRRFLRNFSRYIYKFDSSNINPKSFDPWMSDLLKNIRSGIDIGLYSHDLYDHKGICREGREGRKSRCGDLYTLYMNLSSVYGKYSSSNFMVKENIYYRVCGACFTLASLGLLFGVFLNRYASGKNVSIVFVSVIPRNSVEIADLLALQRLTEGVRDVWFDMPLLASPMYLLSSGETLYGAYGDLDILTWKIAVSGSSQRSLDIVVMDLGRLLEFISEVKYTVPEWPRIVDQCLSDPDGEGATLMAELTEAILFNGDLYRVAREFTSFFTNHGSSACRDYSSRLYRFADALFSVG